MAGAAAAVLLFSACGAEDEAAEPAADSSTMDHSEMTMNDPDATPADEVEGEVQSGDFVVLDTAPPGSDAVTGEAFLAQNDDGTTVTMRLSGLEPDIEYLAHLHEQPCAEDNGGDHFMFDPEGSDVPPNEVHLAFTADSEGSGEATVTNPEEVGDGAPSIVVHPADAMDNRLACADFS